MDFQKRELFVLKIRLGKIKIPKLKCELYPPTIEDRLESCEVYDQAYFNALNEEMMTEHQMAEWMIEHNLWSHHEEKDLEGIRKNIEDIKVEVYKLNKEKNKANQLKRYLRSIEKKLNDQTSKKNLYYYNTCESIANLEKLRYLIKRNCLQNNRICDLEDDELDYVLDCFRESILSEEIIREVSRNEPWRSLWFIKNHNKQDVFLNLDRDITINQQNLLLWSQTYDNIHESLDCPSDDVIDDDDMLDGWLIFQSRKRKQEKVEQDMDKKMSSKVKNSSEVYLMASNVDEARDIDSINSYHAKMIKKQRQAVINLNGNNGVTQDKFQDEILDQQAKQNQQFLQNARRK
jgi:acylphosphatase